MYLYGSKSLPAAATLAAPVMERRRFVRYPVRQLVTAQVITAAEPGVWARALWDISTNGIGLILDRPLRLGIVAAVDLYCPLGFPRLYRVRIKHVEEWPGRNFLVGGAFLQALSLEELRDLR